MTPSATKARGGRQATWTRDTIIEALRRYAALYGDDFTAAAFSPSTAKWRDEPQEVIDRYYAGDPDTGAAWPSLNVIKSRMPGGSFNAARELAGLAVNRPGTKRRKAGEHKPVRDVSHAKATRTIYVDKVPEATLRRLERAEAKVARLERQLAEARTDRRVERVTKTKTKVVREKVTDDRAVVRERAKVERAESAAMALREAFDVAKAAEREARTTATKLASRLERSEATVSGLRTERRDLKADLAKAEDRATAFAAELAAAREELARERRERRVIVKDAPEQAIVDEALAAADRAAGVAHQAEMRAAKAEREYLELAAAATGEPRRLSRAEVGELRRRGPAGRPVLAAALKELAKAKSPAAQAAALTAVASAAVSWKERL